MEKINGISFEDWAASCGQLTQGMSEETICQILGIEYPVWQDTHEKWSNKLSDLMAEDMNISTQYGDIFANPNIGPYAEKGIASTEEEWRKIVPDYQAFLTIQREMSEDAAEGGDTQTFLSEKYGLNIGQWGQISSTMIHYQNSLSDEELMHEMRKGMINPEYQKQMEKVCPTYESFLALENAVDEILDKEEELKRKDPHHVSFFPERDFLSSRGVDMDLYHFMEKHYENWLDEKEEEMGEDDFEVWLDAIQEKVKSGKVPVPKANFDEDGGLSDDIDF